MANTDPNFWNEMMEKMRNNTTVPSTFHWEQMSRPSINLGDGYYFGGHGSPFEPRELTDENIQADMRRQMERDNAIRLRFKHQRMGLQQGYAVDHSPLANQDGYYYGISPFGHGFQPFAKPETLEEQEAKYFNNFTE